jgi:hypothetical protein
MAKRLTPEKLTTMAVTRHLKRIISAGNYPVSGFPLRYASLRAAGQARRKPRPGRSFYNNRYFLYLITAGGD